ncbi:MAG: Ig-like domain-containing protein [Lachnospiraceae bacterium]|nr:Ig-like domain-containing protein [Lachnospiraceae bacterium]
MKKKQNMVKWWLAGVMMFVLMLGAGGTMASAAIDLPGKIVGEPLFSGMEKTKEGGAVSWQCVSVIYDEALTQDVGYRTLLIEGNGSTLDYTTSVYCEGETSTPWYNDIAMKQSAFAFVGEGITSLGRNFLAGMGSMMYISLPESLISIGDEAFAKCSNLREIYIPPRVTSIGAGAFDGAKENLTIRCRSNSYAHRYAADQGIPFYLTDKSECENKGHCWSSWSNSKVSGKQERSCSVCSEKEYRNILVSSVKISGQAAQLLTGKKIKLTASVSPSDAANKKVKWSSSNSSYASVTQSGVVLAKSAGAGKTVTITAAARDGSRKKATYKIKLRGAVRKITLTPSRKTVKAGGTVTIKAKVTVGAGGSKALKWASSNKKYAVVSAKGIVTTKKAGKGRTVRITAAAKDGSAKSAAVTIKIK